MALANVTLTNTFDTWRIRTNQLIIAVNDFTANDALSANATAQAAYGAGNTNYTYAANTVMLVANSAYAAGNTNYTYAANTVMLVANTAYDKANAANSIASPAFDKANSANSTADTAAADVIIAQAKGAAAHVTANTANTTAGAAYDKANTANSTADSNYTYAANTVMLVANSAYDKANTANITADYAAANAIAAFAAANTVSAAVIGQQTVWVPAGAMEPRVATNPATLNTIEMGTSLLALRTMDFATGADDFAGFGIQMPRGWDESTVIAQYVWSALNGSGGVTWGIRAGGYSDSAALTTALGTIVTTDDTFITANDIHISQESTAITVANAAEEDWVYFEVHRDVSDANDTLAVDARLHGVKIHYNTDAATDS
jgi:hypothetical protein